MITSKMIYRFRCDLCGECVEQEETKPQTTKLVLPFYCYISDCYGNASQMAAPQAREVNEVCPACIAKIARLLDKHYGCIRKCGAGDDCFWEKEQE